MKIAGIILIVLGGINIFGNMMAMANNPSLIERGVQQLFFAIGILGLGIYLVNRAKKKQQKQQKKEKWNNN